MQCTATGSNVRGIVPRKTSEVGTPLERAALKRRVNLQPPFSGFDRKEGKSFMEVTRSLDDTSVT